jgi:hypothetical protein
MTFAYMTSDLPWLIIHHFHTVRYLSSKLDKFLVRWVFVYIVISVLYILELDHEAVRMWILGIALVMVLVGILRHTACPSELLFFLRGWMDALFAKC